MHVIQDLIAAGTFIPVPADPVGGGNAHNPGQWLPTATTPTTQNGA